MPSLDTEKRFIAALLRSNEAKQEDFFRRQIPRGVFVVRTKEVEWVYNFREHYGKFPSAKAFEAQFDYRLPKVKDPVEATIQPVLDLAMFEQMRAVQEKAKKLLDDGNITRAMDVFKAGAHRLTSYSTSYVDISLDKSRGADRRYREHIRAQRDPRNHILDSPWSTLNRVIKFFRPGEQIVIPARLGIGKSWLIAYWAHYYAMRGIKTLLISKEMPGEQFEERIEAIRYRLPYEDYRDGTLPPAILRRWRSERYRDEKSDTYYPLIIVGSETLEGIGLSHIIAKIQEYQPLAVFTDGGYLIRPEELPANTGDTQRFTYLSNRTKGIAKHFRVLHVVSVQDNREAEDKKGYAKGSVRTVYGADAWAQDADYVLGAGGKRGTDTRELRLLKGRESNLVEFNVKFQLDPKPNFRSLGKIEDAADRSQLVKKIAKLI